MSDILDALTEEQLEELRERNPDVEFELDEEEMISIPTKDE